MTSIALALLVLWIALIAATVGGVIRVLAGDRALDTTVEVDDARLRLRELTERKAVLVELLRTTEDDFASEKIIEADYRRTRRSLEREALGVMRAIEELRGEEDDLAAADAALEDVRSRVARESADGEGRWSAAALRRHGGVAPAKTASDDASPAAQHAHNASGLPTASESA
ncbi:MAG: hypothetical protein EA398_18025 [Deltaproteobacteria bacterium]|nr:MAG: hypothetical protein EA398_18025 [Deltaproteobacteria bacterium]